MKRKSIPMTEQEAVFYTAQILDRKGLLNKLRCQLTTLFRENRRAPDSPLALKNGIPRGNRNVFGFIPFSRKNRTTFYERRDLNDWLASVLIPMLTKAS